MSSVSPKVSSSIKRPLRLFEQLRALAIVIILFHHLPAHSFDFYRFSIFGRCFDLNWLNHLNRYFALSLFTFMSGYLLEYRYPSFTNTLDIRNFFIKRYIRIYPLYLLSLLIYFRIFTQFIDMNLCTIIMNGLGLQIILARKTCLPVMTLWYIGLIFTYYFIFVSVKLFVNDMKSAILFMFFLIGIFIFLKSVLGVGDKRLLLYLPVFLAGIYSCRIKVLERLSVKWITALTLALVSTVFLYIELVYPRVYLTNAKPLLFSTISIVVFVLVNLIMLCFVLWIINIFHTFGTQNPSRITGFISYSSYATYLFHRPLWWLMTEIYRPQERFGTLVYMMGLGIPLALLVGYCAQFFYDKHLGKPLVKKLTG